MATTRIMPMHINKGKTISQCMKARIDYVKNPDKTEEGTLVSSYACTPESADHEFVLARNEYRSLTGKLNPKEVIAYQLRQSFKPGEVTPEEANRIGYELAARLLGGDHAFIVATHTDRKHIHNHIVFCATTLDCTHKFRNRWNSSIPQRLHWIAMAMSRRRCVRRAQTGCRPSFRECPETREETHKWVRYGWFMGGQKEKPLIYKGFLVRETGLESAFYEKFR